MVYHSTVDWFNAALGYGFLKSVEDRPGEAIFVHYSNIAIPGFKTLVPGGWVQFELGETEKGLAATNVLPLEGAP